jgi:hypothetical protein
MREPLILDSPEIIMGVKVSDKERGMRMVEETALENIIDTFAAITDRTLTDEGSNSFSQVEGSPDFILGLDGKPLGIEIAEVRGTKDAEAYFDEVSGIAWKKHETYERRGLFKNPTALLLYSSEPPLFDMRNALNCLAEQEVFDALGFVELWTADLSDDYFTPGRPLRVPDMFCMKPTRWWGFHRIGPDRKPFG